MKNNFFATATKYSLLALTIATAIIASESFAKEPTIFGEEPPAPRSYYVYPQFPEVKFTPSQLTVVKGGTLIVTNDESPEQAKMKVRLFDTSRIPNSPASVTFLLEPLSSEPVQMKPLHDIDYSIKTPQLESKYPYMGVTGWVHDTFHPDCRLNSTDACPFIYMIPLVIDVVKSPLMLVANVAVDQAEPMKCAQDSLAFLMNAENIGQVRNVSNACFTELITRVED